MPATGVVSVDVDTLSDFDPAEVGLVTELAVTVTEAPANPPASEMVSVTDAPELPTTAELGLPEPPPPIDTL